ncbi:MAG: STAS/SEC14 domain-containing protein, partial [Leptolyngbyaceae cyanobacterium CSU_1_4]|nr:STAS/SEC14 domain-containing protein [Leptolyngbyaceae cyanobacterium CSU_1_4]
MIEYKNNPNNNIAEITIKGKITEADFDRVSSQMKADIDKHGKLRLLEEFHSFEGIDPIALWKDAKFGLAYMDDLTHIAVVAEPTWMQTIASAVDNLLSAKVKAFDSSQIEQAREWLVNAPEPSQDSIVEYRNNPDNNIIEISVKGKVSEADFD